MPFFFRKKKKESKAKLEHCWQLARHGPDDFIDFSDCDLHEIPVGTYATCRVLLKKALILSENKLETLEEDGTYEDFEKLHDLVVLDLHSNYLKSLPTSIGYLCKLQIINLENNRLCALPDSFAQLVSLQTVNLKCNRFKILPLCVCELTSLRTLDISQNSLTELPRQLWKCRCLETLILNPEEMIFPESGICSQGTPAIMKNLCAAAGVDYIPPSKALLSLLPSLTAPLPGVQRGGSLHCARDDSHMFDASIEQYQKQKDEKRKQQLALEKSLQDSLDAQVSLMNDSDNHHRQLVESLSKDQADLDARMKEMLHSKDMERTKFLEILRKVEDYSQNLTMELVKFNQQARKSEQLLDEEEKRRKIDENWFKVQLEDQEKLRRQEIQCAMEQMLASCFGLEELRKMNEARRKASIYQAISEEQHQADAMQASLVARDKEMARLTGNLLREEAFQKEALEALMIQRDAKTLRINGQIRLIQEELAKLSCVELKNRALRIASNVKTLDHQRQDLSLLLMQLLHERDRRSEEIKNELIEMERHKQDELADYWLIQFQRLKDSKPTPLADAEKNLDPEVVMLLQKSCAEDYLPAFARHHVTYKALFDLTEEDLQKIGIYSIGLRKTILSNILNLADKESVDTEKTISTREESNGPSASAGLDSLIASRSHHWITARFEVECVICLDLPSAIVLIPCGHLCVCNGCSRPLTICPMCRASIADKVDLKGMQPSAPSADLRGLKPSAPCADAESLNAPNA